MRVFTKAIAVLGLLLADKLLAPPSRDQAETRAGLLARAVLKHPWLSAGAVAAAVGSAGALVVLSGIVPIRASSGHWPITARFLDFAKTRSVATYSLRVDSPPLDDAALVLRGAVHYDNACYSCHARPDTAISPVSQAMTPPPPLLNEARLARWTNAELFTIVKHGIKLTGMPAWPVQQRDDEVWAMVAFLRRLPTLKAAEYTELVRGQSPADESVPRTVREVCSRCHGVDGRGRGEGAFPSLAGQRAAYLYASVRAFADRSRLSGIMGTVATSLSDDTLREVAAYYERQPSRAVTGPPDHAAIARGEEVALRGDAERDIPSCADCHGPGTSPRNPAFPKLAGQHAGYLASQLELFQARRRGGSAYSNLMHVFVDRLDSEQIRLVTHYYASLSAE